MGNPLVTVGLPVFNGGNFLEKAVESLLKQDYSDFELIISDNASTDSTREICERYAATDSRVRYCRLETNIGAAANYNRVFELARGRYFRWNAHDDECHPTMLRRCVEFLESASAATVMVYPRGELINEVGQTLISGLDRIESRESRPHRRVAKVVWSLNMCDPIFGLIRVEALRKTGVIGKFFGADNVLLTELAMLGEIREINEVLFRLRAHPKRSMKAHATARQRAAWYDPSAAQKLFVLPNWERMVVEMLKAASRSNLPFLERGKCYGAILGVHYWGRFKNFGGRWKQRVKATIEPPGKRTNLSASGRPG